MGARRQQVIGGRRPPDARRQPDDGLDRALHPTWKVPLDVPVLFTGRRAIIVVGRDRPVFVLPRLFGGGLREGEAGFITSGPSDETRRLVGRQRVRFRHLQNNWEGDGLADGRAAAHAVGGIVYI